MLHKCRGVLPHLSLELARPERRSLIDQRGLGKSQTFSGKAMDFYIWAHKLESYVASVRDDFRASLAWTAAIEGSKVLADSASSHLISSHLEMNEWLRWV